MWTESDNSLLRQSQWLDKSEVRSLNYCVGVNGGNYISNTIPALQVQTRPKCNLHNSSLGKALAFIKRAFSRELVHYQPAALQLHNLNYDYQHFNRPHQQQQQFQHYAEYNWFDSFAGPSPGVSASGPLSALHQTIRQIFWGFTNSVRSSAFHQTMLQQRPYTMTTTLPGISKCDQMPKLTALNRRLEAAKQMDSIKESTNLLSSTMTSIISSTTDFIEDLISCLPGSTASLFKQDVKSPVAVSEAKQLSSPPPSRSDKIAFVEFYSKPTYCYFVIDICPHDMDSVDVWHNDNGYVSTAPIDCSKKSMRSVATGSEDNNDANNNSCQMDNSLLSCKSSTSSYIADCSPEMGDGSFWTERNCRRRERNISECSDDFICFMDENEEVETEEEVDEDDEDDDSDDDDDVDEVDHVVVCHWHGKSLVNSTQDFHNVQHGKNKISSLAHRPRDKHCADNDDDDDHDEIVPTLCATNCSGKTKNNANDRLEPKQESSTLKRVRFDLKPEIHTMHTWDYAYRKARKGTWEDFARDRARFQKRIERTALYLNPILNAQHRSKVFTSRFTDPLNA